MSRFFGNSINQTRILMDKKKDDEGGGGGSGNDDQTDHKKNYEEMKTMNAKLLERLEKLEKSSGKKDDDENDEDDDKDDLATKAKKDREAKEKAAADSKGLEASLKFNLAVSEFYKTNAALLPKSIAGVIEQAEKEKYDVATEKSSAIMSGILSEYFALQANLDLLTESQKIAIENFKQLTKTDKQDKAREIYISIFEPTIEMVKRVKKAEQLNKGHTDPTDAEEAYKKKLLEGSSKHYLKERK